MAQAGFTPLLLYYSTTASATPSAGNLANGELAINITDGKLFYKDNAGVVQVIADKNAGGGGVSTLSFGTTGLTPSTATSGAITVAGTLAVGNGGTGATTLTGLVKGNGTSAFTAAVAGTDYVDPTTLSSYALLASPTFTGTPSAPTAAVDTNTTQIATTAYVIGQGYLKAATASSTYAPLASPTFTGTVTAAALTATGSVSLGGTVGAEGLRVTPVASAVNYLEVAGNVTTGGPRLFAQGSDTNISLQYGSKGTGAHIFYTRGTTSNIQFNVSDVASAVNYWNLYGAATTGYPTLQVLGSDTNIGFVVAAKGTGPGVFQSASTQFQNTSGQVQFLVASTASAVNYLQVTGGATGGNPTLQSVGSDANITLPFSSKGTAGVGLYTNGFAQLQFFVAHTASAVNYVQATGAATGADVALSAQGSDTNINLNLVGKGTGVVEANGIPVVTTTGTQTLTDKRVTPRVSTTTSSATPTINTDTVDMFCLTAQAVDITSFTTNLSGTPTNGQKLWICITGTAARAITWGASFEASTVPLPTTTVSTNRLDVGFVWNSVTSKWRCVATA